MSEDRLLFAALGLLLIITAILWIFLPFAIFGTKDILKNVLKEQQRTNELLRDR